MGTADYGQPTDPLSTPSLSQWAEAVHLDAQTTDSEQAAQDARLDVLEAERSLGDLDDVNVADLPPADGDRLAWSDALGQWQPQPLPVNVLGDLDDVILTHPRPTDHLIFDGTVWRNRPAGVLGEAVWHVSADMALPDRLPDLTGQGRDALFGADDAAPRVLPWDGENYLHVPGSGQGAQITTTDALPWTATDRDGGTTTGVTPAGVWLFDTPGDWVDIRTDDGAYILDPATVTDDYATIPNTGSAGGTWTIARAPTGWKTAVVDRPMLLFGGGQWAGAMIPGGLGEGTLLLVGRTWQDTVNCRYWIGAENTNVGGVYAYQQAAGLRAVNMCYVGADNSTRADIQSIGAYGQHVVGARLGDTFDGLLDGAAVSAGPVMEGARLLHDRIVVGSTGYASAEFLGAAIFDRALTDEEIAEASTALLGRPLPAAARHAPLVEGSIQAALPPAQPGSIAVLEDNTIAVRTRTGGWVQLTASPLPGSTP